VNNSAKQPDCHSEFDKFFYKAAQNCPFPFQKRLAEEPELPDLLQVPTGTGKTAAAVLAWVWRRQKHPSETPRRLVYCLPMRVLVEQTRASSVLWLHRVGLLAGQATLDPTGQQVLQYTPAWGQADRIAVARLMGGETDDEWREHPERDVILVGTQDMLMSRALNRGYAAWPQDWPVDFGLLNIDSLWVMDEVQLMGPARTTSAQLQFFADADARSRADGPLPPRRTLWMSATLGSTASPHDAPAWVKTPEWANCVLRKPVASGQQDDFANTDFGDRWKALKQLELQLRSAEPTQSKGKRKKRKGHEESATGWTVASPELVDRVLGEAQSAPGRTVIVFVNRVDRARSLFDRLYPQRGDIELILLHSRFRPRDRKARELALAQQPGADGRIIVSTQVLEAGVDIDADALFTEVCPWPSLVQRLGRLNRRGKHKNSPSPAVVFDVSLPTEKDGESSADYRERARKESSAPYDADYLDVTRGHLATIAASGSSLSPEALSKIEAPIALTGPILRRFDLDDFFDTDPDLMGGHTDVSPFVRALDRDVDAYVVWRRLALSPDEQPPIHPDEICPVPFYEVQSAFARRPIWILTLATKKRSGSPWRRARPEDVRPGDSVLVDLDAGCYTEDSGWLGKGNTARKPGRWVDRWQEPDGTVFRAWVQRDTGEATLTQIIDGRVDSRRAAAEDARSYKKHWMELEVHLNAVAKQAAVLVDKTTLALPSRLGAAVCTAVRWHDVGKALERGSDNGVQYPFQDMLLKAGVPEDGHPPPWRVVREIEPQRGPSVGLSA
jgi:CRISPR-associated endonuclease/helicase Cas3